MKQAKLLNSNKENKKHAKNIKAALSIATGALLGTSGVSTCNAQGQDNNEWQLDSAFLLYSEVDRVSAGELIVNAVKQFDNDEVANVKVTIDALTGASANGAVAQPDVQTFTSPSGEKQYTANAGVTPLDDTFKDTRVQFNGQWTQPLNESLTGSVGGHFSKEYDYLSIGLNGNLAFDFNKNNSTISLGVSHFEDVFTPEGGIPRALAVMLVGDISSPTWEEDFAKTRIAKNDNKSTSDIMLGLTQVINRRMITAFNYSASKVSGYLTDPFKIVSNLNAQGEAQEYIYESRPDARLKQSIFMQSKYHFDTSLLNSVVDISYRYMWDDWQLDSHTIDTRFFIPLTKQNYIEPHFRYYQQSATNFYQPYIIDGSIKSEHVSADYRIGEMTAYTLGAKYGTVLQGGNSLSFRLEYYRQVPNNAGFSLPSNLNKQDVYPVVSAIILQVSYSL